MLVSTASLTSLGALGFASGETFASEPVSPEYDFMDYLGDLVNIEGEWVDPLAMQDASDIDEDETDDRDPAIKHEPQVDDATEGKE